MSESRKMHQSQKDYHKILEFYKELPCFIDLDINESKPTVYNRKLLKINKLYMQLIELVVKSYNESEYTCPCKKCCDTDFDIIVNKFEISWEGLRKTLKVNLDPQSCLKCNPYSKDNRRQFITFCEEHIQTYK